MVAALPLAGAAFPGVSQAARAAPSRVTVAPKLGSPTARFTVTFRAPDGVGRNGDLYDVHVSGPSRRGCGGGGGVGVTSARAGQLVHAKLGPEGGRWCRGTFQGVVDEAREECTGDRLCPPLLVVLRTVGTFTFRVR